MDPVSVDSTGASRGSLASYVAGFLLSVALTIAAFALVTEADLSRSFVVAGIFAAAVVQIVVQLHFFLHLDRSSAMRWNALALLFTLLIMGLFVGGTLWIMHSLHYNMM